MVVLKWLITFLAQAQAGLEERDFEAKIKKHGERF